MIVLVDQDGPLADLEGSFHETWRRERPDDVHVPPRERSTFYVRSDYPAELRPHVDSILLRPGFFAGLSPIPGSVAALQAMLEAGHEVFICTSPLRESPHCAAEKIGWVRDHLGAPWVDRMLLVRDKTMVRGDALIDDRPTVTGRLHPTWSHILWDAPYNDAVDGPRLTSWDAWPGALAPVESARPTGPHT